MKVTLNLDEALCKAAKKLAIDLGPRVTLGRLVEEGLRLVLARKGGKPKPKG